MQSAIDNIKATYDYETCKEIVNHGCQSGVCSEHIYYGDTIEFFNTYENEVVQFISDVLEPETLGDIFKDSGYDQDMFKNNMTWTFIELVAMLVVDEYDEQIIRDDELIASYAWLSNHALSRVWLGTHIPYVHPLFYYDNYTQATTQTYTQDYDRSKGSYY